MGNGKLGNWEWEKVVPNASWWEYAQWLLGHRQRFVVREKSMMPTLKPGDTVLAKMGELVQVGDIAIVEIPTSEVTANSSGSSLLVIKRVHKVFHDGSVFLVSDNAKEPTVRDSRHFGAISANQVVGRVTSRLATAS